MAGFKSEFESITINLEHDIDEQYQYQPGEIIRGKVGLHLHRQTFVQTIFITIQGDGVVAWEDDYERTFQSSENYLDASQAIYDSQNDRPLCLNQGFHDFAFEYQLPSNIPSSFIGKYGSVTYILKAVVQGERRGDTTIASEPFLVLRKLTLPESTHEPVDRKIEKRYLGFCSFGKVKGRIRVEKTGFSPGEDIYIHAEVQNKSSLRVTAIQASLVMNNIYHAQKHSIPFHQIVNKRRDEYELTDGDGRRWQQVRISIPPYIPESHLEFCDIIELKYEFEFRIELSGGKELRIQIPVFLGANQQKLPVATQGGKDVNIHWTVGPKSLTRNGHSMHEDHGEKWDVLSPEFRQPDAEVINPLYRHDSELKGKDSTADSKGDNNWADNVYYHDNEEHHRSSSRKGEKYRDNVDDDRHKSMNHTKL